MSPHPAQRRTRPRQTGARPESLQFLWPQNCAGATAKNVLIKTPRHKQQPPHQPVTSGTEALAWRVSGVGGPEPKKYFFFFFEQK